MIKAGLTGAIGSGKTTVLGFFKARGAAVASADAWVRQELDGNFALRKKLARIFGPEVLKKGRVDRQALARIAFARPGRVRALNRLIHPLVKKRLFAFFRKNKAKKCVVVEVPLLFEAKFDKYFDVTIGVATEPRALRQRLERRENGSSVEARRRMRYQLAGGEKISRCDFVIDNSAAKKRTLRQVNKLMEVVLWKS